ncbi:MAG: protein kinase [Pyrinomonadaceae bacterium]
MKPLASNILIQDRYLIVHLIGKGGMGEVYLAVDQRLGSAVALKRTFFSDDDLLASAFEREARILANLRHPILPKVSDHFIEGDNQFLVMEHITGDDLSKRLEKTNQPFPLSWVLFWADQLLDALHYLHTHEPPIIHRDIKPQNLKLTNDNHIVLLDFGLSKNSVGETRITTTGSVVGYTPHYAPMEQIRGTGTNAQSDIYSLSATLYQLLTNTVPPDALTRADSLLSDLPDPIKPINQLNPEVTPEVSEVILKGMDIRQESRFGTAREMQKSLRDAFAKLQTAMAAQTIAFNVNDSGISAELQSGNSQPAIEPPVEIEPEIEIGAKETGFQTVTELDNSLGEQNHQPEPDFDATVKFDSPEVFEAPETTDSELKPSDIKTEVLLAGDSPAIKAVQEGNSLPETEEPREGQNFETVGSFDFDENKTSGGEFSQEEFPQTDFSEPRTEFSPDATVPLISFRENEEPAPETPVEFDSEEDVFDPSTGPGETDFFEIDQTGQVGGFETVGQIEEPFEEPEPEPITPKPVPPPVVKPSPVKKILAIIAGLFVLLLLFGGAIGGVVWYVTRDPGTNGGVDPPPSPTDVNVEVTPSPESSPEVLLPVNNEENDNTGKEDGPGTNQEVNVPDSKPPDTPGPVKPSPKASPVVNRRTPTPRPSPRITPTPTKTPKGGRTDIQQ